MEHDTPAKPQFYSPLATVAITIGIFFATQVLGGALLGSILLTLNHWTVSQLTDWLTASAWGQFLFVVIVETMTIGILYWFLKRRHISFRKLGLNNPKAKYMGYALGGFAVYFLLYFVGIILAKTLVPSLNLDQKQELGFDTATKGWQLLPIFVSLVVLPPLVEEILARGFLFGGLRAKLSFAPAAVITSLLFASAHLPEATDGLLWVAAIDTFVLSLVLCYLREKTRSLWPSIGLHFLKNGVAFIFLFSIASIVR